MHRFFVPPNECRSNEILLTGGEAHQALHVLRLQRGESVVVLDGAGAQHACEIAECRRNNVRLTVVQRTVAPPPQSAITLLQAVPKGKIIEAIIQKATELGVSRVVPLLSQRVTTKLEEESADKKKEKWQAVAVEAIKQCGSAWLPKIEAPITPQDFLGRQEEFDLTLIGSLQPGSRHAREYFQSFIDQNHHTPRSIGIWIGPEGDFTTEEVAAAQMGGALPITMGPLVLRVETAAIYSLSIVNYELQAARD